MHVLSDTLVVYFSLIYIKHFFIITQIGPVVYRGFQTRLYFEVFDLNVPEYFAIQHCISYHL